MGAFKWTHAANDVATDPFLVLFGFCAVYSLLQFVETEETKWAWVSGVGYGLAILSKAVAAAPFGIFALPYLYRYRQRIGWEGFGRVVAGGVLVTAPWFLIAASFAFNELLDQMFVRQVVSRATGERFIEQQGMFSFMRYPYFSEFPGMFDPWVYLLVPAVGIVLFRSWQSNETATPLFLVWWAASTFGFFVITGNHPWYIMPMFVPCALLIGAALSRAAKYDHVAIDSILLGVLALFLFGGITAGSVAVLFGVTAVTLRDFGDDALSTILSPDAYTTGKRLLPVLCAAVLVVALIGAVPFTHDRITYNEEERFGQRVAAGVPAGETVAIEGGVYWERLFLFSFYLDRPLVSMWTGQLNGNNDIQYAVVLDERLSELERDYTVHAEYRKTKFIEFS